MSLIIRPANEQDFGQWEILFAGYCDFYSVPSDLPHREHIWSWLMDENHVSECHLAILGDLAVGLIHFRAMPSQLRGSEIGFLDDLYVAPDARGQAVATALLHHLKDISKERGWPTLRWLTAEDNYQARNLYDKIGQKTAFIAYGMDNHFS